MLAEKPQIVAVELPMKNLVALGPTFERNSSLAVGLSDLRPGATAETKRTAPPSHPIAEIM